MANKNYINGNWVAGSDEKFRSFSPSTGDKLGEFYETKESQIEKAVESAHQAFEDWSNLSYIDRADYLWDVHKELKQRKDELGKIVSRECGKEINEGKADIEEAAHMVEWAAGNARHPHGDVIPSEVANKDSYMRRKPRGVTGCITPWNFPIAIPFWHMAVALVEGNTVVWKPAEQTPLCGYVIAEIMDKIDIPDGVFNLVQGHADVGSKIVNSEKVSTVLFTGSAEVGQIIQEQAVEYPNKKVACEMGGKNSMLVTDAADVDLGVKCAILSSFKTTGQRCVSTERIIIHSDIYEEFKQKFVSLARSVEVGNPLEHDTFMGPLIDKSLVEKFKKYNQIAKDEGADVLVNREELNKSEIPENCSEGNWVGPFVYEIDYGKYRCLQEEVFGPHVALIEYEGNVDSGINMHNDTDYGLTGAIISEDYRQINKFRDNADVGFAYANIPCIGAEVQLPFGGVNKSGHGSPSAREVIETVTDRTAWTVNNNKSVELTQGLSSDINLNNQDDN